MLQSHFILLAEDEPITAMALVEDIKAANGRVIGPFHSISLAMAEIAATSVHAAILDVELADGLVTPLALRLFERGVILLFHSASSIPAEITQRCGKVCTCPKPMASNHVVRHLAALIRNSA